MPNLNPAEAASSLIKRINDERSAAKLGPLAADPRLTRAAEAVAADLARNKGKRTSPSAFEQIEGRLYKELAMTTSGGQPDANVLVKSLMDNPDTRPSCSASIPGSGSATRPPRTASRTGP